MDEREERLEKLYKRLNEKLNHTQEISDGEILAEIDHVILEEAKEHYMPLAEKIALRQQLFNGIRRLDILQQLLEDEMVTDDAIVAAALAVPVTLQGRTGNYLCLCGEGSLLLAGLLDTLCAHQKLRGAGFTVTVPADAAQAALLQDKGFANAFALRCLPREVSRNLWSQAEFDTVTAKKLCELREQFWKDTVQLSPERMAVVLQELYARGATIVSNEHGYGIYFRKEDTLYFVEMMADSDRAAEILMEAAREKEVIVEKAVITVGAAQPLFLGEGTRQEYGMIRFDAEPFDVSESYLRLMLEN